MTMTVAVLPRVTPGDKPLGASVEGLDLSIPLDDAQLRAVRETLGRHGVLRFPGQILSAANLHDFSARFGTLEINVGGIFQEPGLPQVMILSNIVRDGKPIGIGDAGQDWHTDMSYSATVAFANVLYALQVPHRDGRPLGATRFADMAAAYDALPAEVRARIDGRTATHDFEKFWEMMRRERNSPRPPLTEAQRKAKPPVSHPLVMVHPLSGRRTLYANPGYAMHIDGMPRDESDELLAMLFAHQVEERFIFTFEWTEGDVLMWDNLRVIHKAMADYRPDEPRLIKRCQVMADQILPGGTAGAALSVDA
jgi:taurine dioxygenase